MLAMGASALAFTPARNVLVGEGPSECILLPTLLREVLDVAALDFQVAPGLSNASESTLPALLDSGARVVFLCDADKGGRARAGWLKKAGADADLVILYDDNDVRLDVQALEDLLRPEVFAEAVNRVLNTYSITDKRVDPAKLWPLSPMALSRP
jgi:predicted ATP-dependent endonuclease of OLD family